MAGEDAAAAGLPVVSPQEGLVREGADEINATRDMIANRSRYGTVLPTRGSEGHIFFLIVGG